MDLHEDETGSRAHTSILEQGMVKALDDIELGRSGHSWSVKSDPKTGTYHHSEEDDQGSHSLDVLSSPLGYNRFYRGSDNYGLEKNERHSRNSQHDFHRGTQVAADIREVRNPTSLSRGSDNEEMVVAKEDRALSESGSKSKRSSTPSEEGQGKDEFEVERSRNVGISSENEAGSYEAEGDPRYGNQIDVGVDGFNADSTDVESDAFDEIEKGEEVEGEGPNIGSSSSAEDSPQLNPDSDNAGETEDGDPVETEDRRDDKSGSYSSLKEQETKGYHRDSRASALRQRDMNLRGPYKMRRSKYKGQDDEMNEKENSEQEWDGAEYNDEDSAIDFPYEKGYLDVKGLDSDLGTDRANFARLVARKFRAGFQMSGE
ncbi:uncharacterized protein [Hetaerina americana]|uniref:uncharacterized protein n=1 Tax=Hetaerina americana TaxID=62018 RepID=UPI003A7F46C9